MSIKSRLKRLIKDKETRAQIMQKLSFIDDVSMIKILYWINTGKTCNLDNPRTFNEKIQWYKLYYRKPIMTKLADKIAVKRFVSDAGYPEIVTPVYAEWKDPGSIRFEDLPSPCILKCNHNSDGAIIWTADRIDEAETIRGRIRRMLQNNQFWGSREWCYKDIEPLVFAEELLQPKNGELIDWNVFCFNGVPKLVLCNKGLITASGEHSGKAARAAFLPDFTPVEIESGMDPIPIDEIQKPQFYNEMLEVASRLAVSFPQVRVDFFQIDDNYRFGEMTFYSSSGYSEWKPEEWQYRMGDWFHLPNKS
ncbi:ATP-grasp fold amidoligase family protein [Collinsella tanakaei]|uniref:ATP-grasp fold amidoligase family protein n=1 Tax=Collinsella tanakaei TaxID=626935 RepID=UPI0025A33AF4|nr:ATP-grasp fold amidoligase family protein [Collinsella tanakaei]MDM8246382.1 ATP-grasp fold amidoligase family protein [Collinsella tanakaei]